MSIPRTHLVLSFCVLMFLVLTSPAWGQVAQPAKFIRGTAPEKGLCVLLGKMDPNLPVEVAKGNELVIYVQLPEDKQVLAVRQAAAKAGLLGARIYVEKGEPEKIFLADNLADAVFVPDPQQPLNRVISEEIERVMHPNSMAYYDSTRITKQPAKETDVWSHPYHGPDNNPQSQDKLARGPFLTHFMAEPWYAAMPQVSVIAGGRIFKVFGNRTSKQPQWTVMNTLLAMNAYNGTILWKKDLKPGFMWHRNNLVATDKTLFFVDDTSCKLIDPATGEIRDEIVVPEGLSDGPVWSWMAVQNGVLYALVGKKEPPVEVVKTGAFRGAGWPWWRYKDYDFGFGRTILAIDPDSKKVLWHHREKEYLDMRGIGMAGNKIFFYSHQKFLGCLDAKSGKVVWKSSDPKMLKAIGDHARAQYPLAGFSTSSYVKCSEDALFFAGPTRKNLVAVSAKDGKLLWQRADGY